MGSQHVCLRFRNHQVSMMCHFSKLFNNQSLVDVTLVCGKVKLRAHKTVLAACSPYFQEIFEANPCKHPVIIFTETCNAILTLVLTFIYDGEVNVTKDKLNGFLNLAERFQICGLEAMNIDGDSGQDVKYHAMPIANSASCLDGQIWTNYVVNLKMDPAQIKSPLVSVDEVISTPDKDAICIGGHLPDSDNCSDQNSSSVKDLEPMLETAARDFSNPSPKRKRCNDSNTFASISSTPVPVPEIAPELSEQMQAENAIALPMKPPDAVLHHDCEQITEVIQDQILDLSLKQKMPLDLTSPEVTDHQGDMEVNPTAPKMNNSYNGLFLSSNEQTVKADSSIPVSVITPAEHPLISFYKTHSVTENDTPVPDIAFGSTEDVINTIRTGTGGTNPISHPDVPTSKCNRTTLDLKKAIIELHLDENLSCTDIGRRLGVSKFKVQNYIDRCCKGSSARSSHTVSRNRKLSSKQEEELLNFIRANKKITQVEIQAHIKKAFNVSLSINTISRLVKVNAIKLDRPVSTNSNSMAIAQNSLNTIALRYDYAIALRGFQNLNKPIVFVDECVIPVKIATEPNTGPTTANLYVLSALTEDCIVRTVSQRKAFSPETLIEFLDQLRILLPAKPHVFVMSNIVLHRSDNVIRWIRCANHKQLFLPPSSPFLNPLQLLFRKLRKACGILVAENLHAHTQKLRESQVTVAECKEWLQEVFHYIPLCLQKSPILPMHKRPNTTREETSTTDSDDHLPAATDVSAQEENTPMDVPNDMAQDAPRPDFVEVIEID